MRSYRDANSDPGIEIIGRCNKRAMEGLYDNRLPWVQLFLADFRVPSSSSAWRGNPNVAHHYALREIFEREDSNPSTEKASRLLNEAQSTAERIRCRSVEREAKGPPDHEIASLQLGLRRRSDS